MANNSPPPNSTKLSTAQAQGKLTTFVIQLKIHNAAPTIPTLHKVFVNINSFTPIRKTSRRWLRRQGLSIKSFTLTKNHSYEPEENHLVFEQVYEVAQD